MKTLSGMVAVSGIPRMALATDGDKALVAFAPIRSVEAPVVRARDVVQSARTPVATAQAPVVVDAASRAATFALTTNSIPLSSQVSVNRVSRYNGGSGGCGGGSGGGHYYSGGGRGGFLGRLLRR